MAKQVKMIALDLDGTLLNQDISISPLTRSCIKRLCESGHIMSIVTGRSFEETCSILEQNGIVPESGYPQHLICEERDVYSLVGQCYEPWERNEEIFSAEREQLSISRQLLSKVEEELDIPFFVNNTVLQNKRGFIEIFFSTVDLARQCFDYMEGVVPSPLKPIRNNRGIALRYVKAGKRCALEHLVDSMGLMHQDVLVMGDSHNDLSMLMADFSVATTENADREIKEAVLANGGQVSALGYSSGVADVLIRVFGLKDVS